MKEAYIAGLIDGEGTITLSRLNKSKFRSPVISLTSTSYELVEFLKKNYGGSIRNHKTYKKHHKPSWSWILVNNKALNLLIQILPYMLEKNKRYRANLLINEYKQVTVRNGKYSNEQLVKKLNFEQKFFHPSHS